MRRRRPRSARRAVARTLLERPGAFSQSKTAAGQPVTITDPRTGLPFADAHIPSELLSPQAQALLQLYPAPNLAAGGRFNYESPILAATSTHSVQARVGQTLNQRNNLQGTVSYQRTANDTTSLFGFQDENRTSVIDSTLIWQRRFNQFFR